MKFKYCSLCVLALVCLLGCKNLNKNDQISGEKIPDEKNSVASENFIQEEQGGFSELGSSDKKVDSQKSFQPFNIYIDKGTRDNHYVPSGYMGDWQCVDFNDTWQKDCQQGASCISIKYDIDCSRENEKWAGIYWLNPSNNWGNVKGGFDLTGATKLVFWAKGAKGGEQIQEFTIGDIDGDYPDSDTIVMGPVILSSQWKEYTIDLRGKDLSYISGGFSWTTSEEVNPENCYFYLDNIRFE